MVTKWFFGTMCWMMIGGMSGAQAVPQIISFQGRIQVEGADFNGTGLFKFALVDREGTTTFWDNDGSGTGGSEPTAAVSIRVADGLYSVPLGDASLDHMTAIPASVFVNEEVFLRIWFDDGANGPQLLAPDQRIAAVGYAMMAANAAKAANADSADTVADGAITSSKLATAQTTDGSRGMEPRGFLQRFQQLLCGYFRRATGCYLREFQWNSREVSTVRNEIPI